MGHDEDEQILLEASEEAALEKDEIEGVRSYHGRGAREDFDDSVDDHEAGP